MRAWSSGRLAKAALVALATVSLPRAAFAAGCKVESVTALGEAESNQLLKRMQEGLAPGEGNPGEPTEFYRADIDNDGKPEIVGAGWEGNVGALILTIAVERNGKLEYLSEPPKPKGLELPKGWTDELWYQRGAMPGFLLKYCDKTIIALGGKYGDGFDGFMWKGGKTVRVCDPDWTAHQMSMFKDRYDKRAFAPASRILRSYLETCGPSLPPETRLSILSNLAITSFHLGKPGDCLGYVKQAKAVPGFDASKSKAALLFNEASCAKPAAR